MNKKNGTKFLAMMLFLVFIVQVGAGASRTSSRITDLRDDVLSGRKQYSDNETYFIDLNGSIKANLFNSTTGFSLKSLVYPTIEMPGEQDLFINTSDENGSWVVNATLRIRVDKPEIVNHSYLLPRCITVFAIVMRKNQPLISGVLRDLFLGRMFTRINVFKANSSDYILLPLKYTAKEKDEEHRVFIVAIGSVVGFFASAPPLVVLKTVDLNCHYSNTSADIIPPVTTIELDGIWLYEGTYDGAVKVSFLSNDEQSMVDHTSYSYTYRTQNDLYESGWSTYTAPDDFMAPGRYDFSFYSVDAVGNVESIKKASFNIM